MSTPSRIRTEFTRQAESMAAAPAFTDADVLARVVSAVAPTPAMAILDVGCGPGILAVSLARVAGEVVGLDLTPRMLEKTRERSSKAGLRNVRLALGQAEALPFAHGSFAAAVTRATLHHFLEPRRVLREMARVVRPGGRVVVADVVSPEDSDQAALHNALEALRDPSHVRMLSASELEHEIQGAGLRVVATASWDMAREFAEWMRITGAPERAAPLLTIMRSLARAGLHAGITLQESGQSVRFTHRWCLATAEPGAK